MSYTSLCYITPTAHTLLQLILILFCVLYSNTISHFTFVCSFTTFDIFNYGPQYLHTHNRKNDYNILLSFSLHTENVFMQIVDIALGIIYKLDINKNVPCTTHYISLPQFSQSECSWIGLIFDNNIRIQTSIMTSRKVVKI